MKSDEVYRDLINELACLILSIFFDCPMKRGAHNLSRGSKKISNKTT